MHNLEQLVGADVLRRSHMIAELVDNAQDALEAGNLERAGELLHDAAFHAAAMAPKLREAGRRVKLAAYGADSERRRAQVTRDELEERRGPRQ